MLSQMLGEFNFRPPTADMSEYKSVPFTGKTYAELEELCSGYQPDCIGLIWTDYSKVIYLMFNEYKYPFMLFEKFYDVNKNPVRQNPDKVKQMSNYIVVLSTAPYYEDTMIIKRTEHFGLIRNEALQ